MTFEQRMAALGVDLSDLPKSFAGGPEPYPLLMLSKANGAAWDWYLDIDSDMENYDSTRSKMVLKLYILHLIDIIDRMETRLVNVTGERDWMQSKCCALCFKAYEDGSDACDTCDIDEGVPEDRRPNDD